MKEFSLIELSNMLCNYNNAQNDKRLPYVKFNIISYNYTPETGYVITMGEGPAAIRIDFACFQEIFDMIQVTSIKHTLDCTIVSFASIDNPKILDDLYSYIEDSTLEWKDDYNIKVILMPQDRTLVFMHYTNQYTTLHK